MVLAQPRKARSQRLRNARTAVLAAVVVAGASITAVSAAPPPTVLLRDNLASIDQIDTLGTLYPPFEPDTQIEPSIAVNPADPTNAVAGFQQGRADHGASSGTGWASTHDSGQTWITGNVPGLTKHDIAPCGAPAAQCPGPWDRASDPVVAFGPNNTVYFSSLLIDGDPDTTGTTDAALSVNQSTDGGVTWSAPVFMHSSSTITGLTGFFDDKNWIVVDNGTTGTSGVHHHGRVYVAWDVGNVSLYAYCDADTPVIGDCSHSMAWSSFANGNQGFFVHYAGRSIGSIPLVLNDGSVEIVLDDFTLNEMLEVTAAGAGAVAWPAALTFAAPVPIATPSSSSVPEQRAGPDLPTAAVDASAGVSGIVYVGWLDNRFRTDGVNDAVFAASDASTGQVWGAVKRINTGPINDFVDSYNTMLAVGPDGSLRAGYRQRNESGSQPFTSPIDTFFEVSYDGGNTFTSQPPVKVDTQATNDGYCAFSRGGCFLGDYNQLAAAGADTYIVREEAYASFAGEPFNNVAGNFSGCPTGSGPNGFTCHTHQRTWVAVVGPQSVAVPEAPWVGAIAVVGGITVILALGRRELRRRVARLEVIG